MYLYVGEYTHNLTKRINSEISRVPISEKEKLRKLLDNVKKRVNAQKKKFGKIESHHYIEIRKKPLQFTREKGIFQKGVDVQIASDLISNAYMNNYDIAVLFSGDVDLLESVRLVKSLGKQIIIFSHFKNTAVEMRKVADMYVNIQNLKDSQLDQFSHIFKK